jgi:ribosome biogenesis protein Nip4
MKEIQQFIKKFSDKEIPNIIKKGRDYYLVKPELLGVVQDYFSIGLPLGSYKKEFKPTSALLEILSKNSENKVFINKKAEWLFLCGRDVFGANIVKKGKIKNMFLVQNEQDENLGLGKLRKKGNKNTIKNLLDRGEYLRKEKY